MPDSCTAFGCTNRRSTTSLQFYCIPSANQYPERRMKWVTAMRREKWLAKKINTAQNVVLILQLMSHLNFQKHEFLLQLLLTANKNLCQS